LTRYEASCATDVSTDSAELHTEADTEQTRRLRHVNRLYAVLSAVNRAIIRNTGRVELLQDICRILVEVGEFRMAWFGIPDAQGWIIPEAVYGDTRGYLATIRTSVRDIPQGRGPTGTAIRENRPVICNDIPGNPFMHPWKAQAAESCFNANAAFPVRLPSGVLAGLVIYSSEKDFFSTDEEKLVQEICADTGYALEFIATEQRRAVAEEHLVQERTRLKALVGELTESEQKFHSFSNAAPDAIILLDDQDQITFWNSAAERIFGYGADEMMGQRLHPLLTPPQYCAAYHAAQEHFTRTGQGNAINRTRELTALRKNGEEFPVELSLSSFRIGGRWQAAGILRDITKRKGDETTLREQAEQLQEEVARRRSSQELLQIQQHQLEILNAELEKRIADEVIKNRDKDRALMHNEKMVSLGQLAAGVAHEINNPMGYIASNLRILSKYLDLMISYDRIREEAGTAVPTPEQQEMIANCRKEMDIETILEDSVNLVSESLDGAQQVTNIVQDMKSFSRVDAVFMQPVSLESCLERALHICHNELKYVASIRKEYEPGPDILGHPGQLNQVFLNLLVNAGQAITPPGEIVVRCWHDTEFVYAAVSDTGSGIPDTVMEKIFDPFFTTKEEGKGTGLGLSISFEIIKKHQGELFLESTVGKGTTFTVKLPALVN
jgi:PAS domain S-box-containing protein